MMEADHHLSLHVDFGKFLPKLASNVNYLFAHTCRVSILVKTSVVDVSRRRRSVSTAVKSTRCLKQCQDSAMLTAQLIVDKHRAMVLANVTFKALAAIWHRHTDMRFEGQVYA